MSYVAPNTTIKICKYVPLDPGQEITLLFPDLATQTAYFTTKTKYTLTAYSYQRDSGIMRVAKKKEDLLDCNYLAYQNTSYGTKWFYAFINSIEYVNNETSEIRFTIDPMQTWHFDYTLEQCYVEREHSATDVPGDNTIPENLELGDYISDSITNTGYLTNKSLVLAATWEDTNYQAQPGMKLSGLVSGLVYNIYPESQYADMLSVIARAGNNYQGIVSVFYYPTDMLYDTTYPANPVYKTISKTRIDSGAIGGYTPTNKKLYTYPYSFLYVTNLQGNSAIFPYEYFEKNPLVLANTLVSFVLTGDFSPTPTFWLYPRGYKGVALTSVNPEAGNYDEGMSISGWGNIPVAVDMYKAWSAMQGSNLITGSLSSALSGFVSGGAAGAVSGFVSNAGGGVIQRAVAEANQAFHTAAAMPNQARGSFSPMSQLAIGVLDFWFMHKCIRPEYARIIDEYFTRYGYACHRVKVPNRTARPKFNYIKTIGCQVDSATGSGLPADDKREIERIYDKGITFWRDTAVVGDYTVNNAPVTSQSSGSGSGSGSGTGNAEPNIGEPSADPNAGTTP